MALWPPEPQCDDDPVAGAVERLALRVLALAAEGRVPAVAVRDPRRALIVEGGGFAACEGPDLLLEATPKTGRRLARLFAALDLVHHLRATCRTATQRELFYRAFSDADAALFREQEQMNGAIRDAVGALRLGRPQLGILTAERGLVAGSVAFCARGAPSSAARGASGAAISEKMLACGDGDIDVSGARCVLVVEKDTFFQHLLQGGLLAMLPLVMVTGRGYPDVLTRRLLQRLQRTAPHLPQVYLGDYDPDGAAIFLLYRASCPWLRWLGLLEPDIRRVPSEASLPLTKRDRALRESLLKRLDVTQNKRYEEHLASMDRKVELEALHAVYGAEGVGLHFVPERILRRAWI